MIGDYGIDSEAEARVGDAWCRAGIPISSSRRATTTTPSGEAATIDANIGKYYGDFIGNYRGRLRPGLPDQPLLAVAGQPRLGSGILRLPRYFTLPGNERYYDVDVGLVHLYAVDSDPLRARRRHRDSVQGEWLRGRSRLDVLLRRRVLPPPTVFVRPATGRRSMRWPFATGAPRSSRRARPHLRAGRGRSASPHHRRRRRQRNLLRSGARRRGHEARSRGAARCSRPCARTASRPVLRRQRHRSRHIHVIQTVRAFRRGRPTLRQLFRVGS